MLKNISANWVLTFLSIITAYLLMPYSINALGEEGYGIWILIGSNVGYLSLLVLGIPMTSVRYLARFIAEKDQNKINEYVQGIAAMYLSLGIVCGIIGIGLFFIFGRIFSVPDEFHLQSKIALALAIFNVAVGFIQQLPYGILSAYQDFVTRNLLIGSSTLLRLILTILLLWLWPTITTIALIQTFILILEMSVSYLVLRGRYPEIIFGIKPFQLEQLKGIFSFSIYVMILNIGVQLNYQTDSLVIGSYLGVDKIAYYTVANSLTIYYMEFIIAIAAVVMPTATTLQTKGDISGLQSLFLKWSKLAFGITLFGGLFLIVLGPRFLGWWINPDFEGLGGQVLQVLMVSFLFLLPARGVGQPILMGLGRPGWATVGFLICGVINLLMSIVLVNKFGLVGVAYGTAVPNIAFGLYLVLLTCHELKLSMSRYFFYVYGKLSLSAIPIFFVLIWFRDVWNVHTFLELFFAGITSVLILAVAWFTFVNRNDPFISTDLTSLRKRFLR